MHKRMLILAALLFTSACGTQPSATQLPTADIRLSQAVAPAPRLGMQNNAPSPTALSPTAITPASAPAATTPLDQYHAWMVEARDRHPYPESVETMWQVMLCESSGDPNAAADVHQGLFQYNSATWLGDWNPYRDQPILDPRAQILATAKAWHDGNQGWWGCYQG